MGLIWLVTHTVDLPMGGVQWQNDASCAADTHVGTWGLMLSWRTVTWQMRGLKSGWVTTGGEGNGRQCGTVCLHVKGKTG